MNNIWEKEEYYHLITNTHQKENMGNDPIFKHFLKLLNNESSKSILDVGCGEGWLIENLERHLLPDVLLTGIDVSDVGLNRARGKNIPRANFIKYDGIIFPFENNKFNAIISSFVFEHLSNPMQIFQEMVRVLKKEGIMIIACPNFGSPLFKSPCNKNKRLPLMIVRFFKELRLKKCFQHDFKWDKVEPIVLPENVHISDYDTLCEPNLSSFEKFLSVNADKFEVLEIDSLWRDFNYEDIAVNKPSILRKFFVSLLKFLGTRNILRFQYFGSFFFVAIRKR
jgi:ubiquinone/menaquinone biosynthesis C-methylase UbiE